MIFVYILSHVYMSLGFPFEIRMLQRVCLLAVAPCGLANELGIRLHQGRPDLVKI